uniref:Adaptor protein, phosphotyrosine interaction, PH domain and leucine zipper containing 1 n=1 Tax=Hippocampus comes TaxID=109280 RepID=A0A3Q2Y3Q8_HIPCM
MPGIEKLPLEETLEDSPQTRSLLGVFEEDTAVMSNYCTRLYQAMHRIYDAQNELSAATHLTSKLLKEYDKQRFPLGGDDEVMSSTLQQFAKVIDELSSCHAVLSTQLADAMMFPITQFKERDLKGICSLVLLNVLTVIIADHDTAINRYSRLSKRKDNDKMRAEAVEDVYTSRKKQHQTMMHYFCSLNMLQYKKKTALLEPLLGYMQAQINFFKMGSENLSQQWEDFLATIGTSVQNVRREMEEEVGHMQQTIEQMEKSCDPLYAPCDPDPLHSPVCRNLTQRQGYLYVRNKTGLVSTSWERQYFFTQGGNLMQQGRAEVAGGLVTDLDNASVMAVDSDDRRFCFQITSFDGKNCFRWFFSDRILMLSAHQWIATINNISRRIYLSENTEEVAARINQLAIEAVTPSPSFQQRHDSMRPASKSRVGRTGSISSVGSEPSPALSALSLDALVAPETPIQFDIISPVSEENARHGKTAAQAGRRSNPFGESGDKTSEDNSILHQLFIVRFLGSMEVKNAESADVIPETMRQILAARAIHNIFRMTESHLLVTCDCLKLIDPQTQVTRLTFPLSSVLQSSSHQDNKRLFGFIMHSASGHADGRAVCYILESNDDGEKICDSIGLAKQIALHSALDLEEQSRLIAASSRPANSAGADGHFVVLSNSQSEDSDAGGEEGKKKCESDA